MSCENLCWAISKVQLWVSVGMWKCKQCGGQLLEYFSKECPKENLPYLLMRIINSGHSPVVDSRAAELTGRKETGLTIRHSRIQDESCKVCTHDAQELIMN